MSMDTNLKGRGQEKLSLACCVGEGLPCFWCMLRSSPPQGSNLQTRTASRRNDGRNSKAVYLRCEPMALHNGRDVGRLLVSS